MQEIVVYSRKGCHLCEVLIETLLPLVRGRAEVSVRDVDSRPEWRDEYGLSVPVVEFAGRVLCRYELDADAVLRALAGEQ